MTDLLRLRAYALVSYFDSDEMVCDADSVCANRPFLAELVDELRDALVAERGCGYGCTDNTVMYACPIHWVKADQPVDTSSPQAALDS